MHLLTVLVLFWLFIVFMTLRRKTTNVYPFSLYQVIYSLWLNCQHLLLIYIPMWLNKNVRYFYIKVQNKMTRCWCYVFVACVHHNTDFVQKRILCFHNTYYIILKIISSGIMLRNILIITFYNTLKRIMIVCMLIIYHFIIYLS